MRRFGAVLLLAVSASATFVYGYMVDPNGLRWFGTRVSFSSAFDTADAQRALNDAIRGWQDALGNAIELQATPGAGAPSIGNDVSEVGWASLPPEVISITRVVSVSSRIVEADVSVSPDAARQSPWNLPTVLAHEVGHALGLGHADDGGIVVRAAMSTDPALTSAALTRDDMAGINEAYRHDDLFARIRGPVTPFDVAFPPRNEPLAFRQQLETTYRDALRRSPVTSFVDIEGTIVWTQEYLRYRLSNCSHTDATARVVGQIVGGGIAPECGGTASFPARNEPLAFRQQLETVYRDQLRRGAEQTYVDAEGDIVWTQEYFRYRVNGCNNQQATEYVLAQVRGGDVQPVCSGTPLSVVNFISTVVANTSQGPTQGGIVTGSRPHAGAGPIVAVNGNASVINGGASQVALTASTPVDRVVVSVETPVSGSSTSTAMATTDSFYVVQLPSPQTNIALRLDLPTQFASQRFSIAYSAAMGSGPFGDYRQQPIQVTAVGGGDVQINVSWNSPADLDLHVIDPSGTEIYWLNRRSATGGELDLDSNSICRTDGPRAENIRWPTGRAPGGTYRVYVDHFENCGADFTSYVVRVINGASSQTWTGTVFGPGTYNLDGPGDLVTTFRR